MNNRNLSEAMRTAYQGLKEGGKLLMEQKQALPSASDPSVRLLNTATQEREEREKKLRKDNPMQLALEKMKDAQTRLSNTGSTILLNIINQLMTNEEMKKIPGNDFKVIKRLPVWLAFSPCSKRQLFNYTPDIAQFHGLDAIMELTNALKVTHNINMDEFKSEIRSLRYTVAVHEQRLEDIAENEAFAAIMGY